MAQSKYNAEWQKVDSLYSLGQLKSAQEQVMKIYSKSKAEKNNDQTLKALLYKLEIREGYEEDFFGESLNFLQEELKTAQPPVSNILNSMLASLYDSYYESESWEINQRTPLLQPSDDTRTWDSHTFLQTISKYYQASLDGAALLQSTPVADYSGILTGPSASRNLRPTLFDLLAQRALSFYTQDENATARALPTFVINEAKWFSPASSFVMTPPGSDDEIGFTGLAIKVYQALLSFHLRDADPSALVDADLARLQFINQQTTFQNHDSVYLTALEQLEQAYMAFPISTEVAYAQANLLQQLASGYKAYEAEAHRWDFQKAMQVAQHAIKRFPKSDGAANCKIVQQSIKQQHLAIKTDQAVAPGNAALALVSYRNINQVYLKVILASPDDFRKRNRMGEDALRDKYLGEKPVKSWSYTLPPDDDFQTHSAEVAIPALKPGLYVIVASTSEAFEGNSASSIGYFWCTDLSMISRTTYEAGNDVLVLDRSTGRPMAGVKVIPWFEEYDYRASEYKRSQGTSVNTDANGYALLPQTEIANNRTFYVELNGDGQQYFSDTYFSTYRDSRTSAKQVNTYLFTDRAIYRPGQTVYFKGIVIESDGDNKQVLEGCKRHMIFRDANYQEIAQADVVTNRFGSYSGSFTAPQGVLTGQMSISDETGSANFRVEEYKRPKFETVFDPVKGSYKLGEDVTVSARAAMYSGSTVSDAKVKYRVVRRTYYPYFWWGWRGIFPGRPDTEITQGETLTDADGHFSITFKAVPDEQAWQGRSPVFIFEVHADVTDLNGETHSASAQVGVGKECLLIQAGLSDDLDASKGLSFSLATTNLNGQPEPATGHIVIKKVVPPSETLFLRKWDRPDRFVLAKDEFHKMFPGEVFDNEDDVSQWKQGEEVYSGTFSTPADSLIKAVAHPAAGMYVVEIRTHDRFGVEVKYEKLVTVFDAKSKESAAVSPIFFKLLDSQAEPGQKAAFLIATPLHNVRVIVEIQSKKDLRARKYYDLSDQQIKVEIPITEADRGNVLISVMMVHSNRFFTTGGTVAVPYTNKQLDITLATFRDKLLPGADEEWKLTITDKKQDKTVAELMACLYDASLDAFVPHNWIFNLYQSFYGVGAWVAGSDFNVREGFNHWVDKIDDGLRFHEYEQMRWNVSMGYGHGGMFYENSMGRSLKAAPMAAMANQEESDSHDAVKVDGNMDEREAIAQKDGPAKTNAAQQQAPPKTRSDFRETAFFFPQLTTNPDGQTVIQFRMPEALTRWRFIGLAHTPDLKSGFIERSLITQKDLMVFPNAPRFLREGDRMAFSAKISNIGPAALTGHAELHFFDALTLQPIDEQMLISSSSQSVELKAGGNQMVSWNIQVPDGLQAVLYRLSATAGAFTDAEEAAMPVLTNRMLVTETMPMPINGATTRNFTLDKLANSTSMGSLRNYRLTLEYTSNPAWYAVQALPYLMEYPYECAEQLFSRFYANTLASHIAESDPKIKKVFDSWKMLAPDALKSNLEKNEELKSILLAQSPWVREAASETESKNRIGLLFDLNKMASEKQQALDKLQKMQTPSGGWPWFTGMPDNPYITRHILSGLGHLKQLHALDNASTNATSEMISKAINSLDESEYQHFLEIKRLNKEFEKADYLSCGIVQFLYARSFFIADHPFADKLDEMLAFYRKQASSHWVTQGLYSRAMLALALQRLGDHSVPPLIMRSLSETALHNDELGMYWRDNVRGWFWYQSPIETQAMLIEAFDEVMGDAPSVEEMKKWLLKQKQTNDWATTKATTEAVYALLMRGSSLLASDKPVQIKVGNTVVDSQNRDGKAPEPGTGYFKTSWQADAIKPEMAKVTVTNPNPGIAWGALYWQYFEQLDKISQGQSPLLIEKKLFREVNTASGPQLEAFDGAKPLLVGDKVVVRVVITTDRDLEYVHLKDMRASALEPLNVLSGYRWSNGLGYYEATGDASCDFFMDYLAKGTYVFEYRLFATQKGEFSNGVTTIECMYAPEFAAHSEGIRIEVK